MSNPSPAKSPAQVAERVQRRRTRVIWLQCLLFLLWQGSFWNAHPHGAVQAMRTVDHLKISAFVVWAAALLLLMSVGGGLLRGREVRDILNDELTTDHRRRAFVAGFWAVMGATFATYLLSLFEPLSLLDSLHLLLTAGVVVPGLTFVVLQRRSDRAG